MVAFVIVSAAAVLTPGPAMLAILGHALARGSRPTVPVVLGNAFGAVVLIGASVAGLSALLAAAPGALSLLKWAGAAYLVWLGLRAWRSERTGARLDATADPGSVASSFARGVLIALSNPKALLFFGAVLPQFVDPIRPVLPQFALMATIFAALELTVTSGVAFAAGALAPLLGRAAVARRIHRAGGAILIAAAALVALAPMRR
ncbi:MAG TPA: LysE family translocator [Haliangiales bacterium]|nr:LysE family translocator [Haliangiales bacterium]